MCQILQLREVRELQVERVHNEPAVEGNRDYHDPQHRHGDVVEENQVVDDGEEEKCEESESDENPERPKPRNDSRLIFLDGKKEKKIKICPNRMMMVDKRQNDEKIPHKVKRNENCNQRLNSF